MMSTFFRASAAIALIIGAYGGAVAQNQKILPPDDSEVYSSFFFFVEDFSAWLDARAAANPGSKANLLDSAARYLKVAPNELSKVTASCRSTAAAVRQINLEFQQYWQREIEHKRAPDVNVVAQFKTRRLGAIQGGISQLQKTLSLSSWNGLHTHINNAYRAGIVGFEGVPIKPPGTSKP